MRKETGSWTMGVLGQKGPGKAGERGDGGQGRGLGVHRVGKG